MKKTLLAAALAAAMPYVAMANDIGTVTVDGSTVSASFDQDNSIVVGSDAAQTVEITNSNNPALWISGTSTGTATILGKQIILKSNSNTFGDGVEAGAGNTANLGTASSESVTLDGTRFGAMASGGTVNITADDVMVNGGQTGLWAQNSGTDRGVIHINANNVDIKAEDYAVLSLKSDVSITASTLNVETNTGAALHVQNNTQTEIAPADRATLTVVADNINLKSNAIGISSYSNGKMDISGNLTIDAPTAIDVRGYSTTNINQNGNGTVVINGDISFETPGPNHNSGNIIDATVNLNLTGENSSWTGNVSKGYPSERKNDNGQNDVGAGNGTGLNLTLSNGAQWNPTVMTDSYDETYQTRSESMALTNLTMNNGVININDVNQTVNVQNMQGSGGTVNVAAQANSDGTLQAASLKVGSAVDSSEIGGGQAGSASGHLAVNYQGINADDLGADTAAAMTQLASNIQAQGATQTQTVAEGDVAGAVVAQVNEDGNVSAVTESANSVMGSLHQIAQNNFLVFRSQMNDMDKRMGDLRTMPQASGMWARAIAGQSEYKSMHNTYQTLQIGADHRIGNFLIGATASYTDGDGSLKNGSSDDKNYNFGLYGSWLGDDGQFVDVTLKRHHTQSDYDLYYTRGEKVDGSMHTSGTSLSVEYGRRFNIANTNYYLEPQAELMYGHLDSADYTTSNGVRISQDAIKSLVGRLGIAAGWVSPEKTGSAYIKASVLNDWEAESDIRASKDGISRKYSEDMGGTWGEFALGGTWNINKNLAAYGEVETTAGNPVRTTYQVSGGIRYSF